MGTHPPRDRLSLKPDAREEAGRAAKFSGKEDGVGVNVGNKEEQKFDDRQKQPGPVQPEDARLQSVHVPATCDIARNPNQLGVEDRQQGSRNDHKYPNAPACEVSESMIESLAPSELISICMTVWCCGSNQSDFGARIRLPSFARLNLRWLQYFGDLPKLVHNLIDAMQLA